jgi:integrase
MRGNSHVRFGGRAEETDRPKRRHRASVRPNHTHASLLVAAGVPIKVVRERLGHAHPAFTIHTYQHLLPGMSAAAAEQFAALVDASSR